MVIVGYSAETMKRPKHLLEACRFRDDKMGGTIHQYLPRLTWKYQGNRARQGPTCHLILDNTVSVGWQVGAKKYLPKITPSIGNVVRLDPIPAGKYTITTSCGKTKYPFHSMEIGDSFALVRIAINDNEEDKS